MSREHEAISISTLMASASKLTRFANASRIAARSSKYRARDSVSNALGISTSAQPFTTENTRLPSPSATTSVSFTKRSSTTRPKGLQLSPSSSYSQIAGASEPVETAGCEEDHDRGSQTTKKSATAEGKLPQKLRHDISRLRLQGSGSTLSSAPSSPIRSPSKKLQNSSPSPPRPSFGSRASRSVKRASIMTSSASTTPQYSRQSQKIQFLHEVMQMQAAATTKVEVSTQRGGTNVQLSDEGETKSLTFFDLLRPLQNSLSCASLMSEWTRQGDDNGDNTVLDNEEAQVERGHSRILRICCSLDNLLLSIGDRVQKEKLDTEIVRGASRELSQLFQYAVKQIAGAAFADDKHDGPDKIDLTRVVSSPQRRSKEAQYALEFLGEVAERFGKLDTFVRTTLLNEISTLQEQIAALQAECEASKQLSAQLQTEISDLRDFHAHNGITSLSLRGPDPTREADYNSLELQLPTNSNQHENESAENKLEAFKNQCDEYARLLEMAKQEIRLSHHERDLHKAHVEELSSALFKDSEIGTLRNQLQSEKKRVRILEMENLTLLERQNDQALRIQSLLLNKSPPTANATTTASDEHVYNGNAKPSAFAGSPTLEGTSPSDSSTHEDASIALCKISIPTSISIETSSRNFDSEPVSTTTPVDDGASARENKDEGCANWFYRLMVSIPRTSASTTDAVRASKLGKVVATLPQSIFEQTRARRQANVPSIPSSSLGLRSISSDSSLPQSGSKKRKLKTSASAEKVVDKVELEHSCLCLIWFFLQRFLMAQEADMLSESPLFDGCAIGGTATSPSKIPRTSLQFVIYHFFLERASSDKEAIVDISDFVQCLQLCSQNCFEIDLFCSFLDGRRSHDDLNFFLWVLQAVSDTEVGISYDECAIPPASQSSGSKKQNNEAASRYVCALKATFVARAVFRLLHFKSSSMSASTTPAARKPRPSTAPSRSVSSSSLVKSASPISPSKRKLKGRPNEDVLTERSKSPLQLSRTDESNATTLASQASSALHTAVEANSGRPVTLEVFNQLLMHFAVAPTIDELVSLLGPFYHATGDEKKVPWEVFIVLLLEMFAHQSKWQREQLRSLFMHLHWQAEIDERAAAKRKAEELALLAASTKKRAGANSGQIKEEKATKTKKKANTKNRVFALGGLESGGELGSKYQRGLSRQLLSEFLSASGIIEDQTHLDIDWLFVRVLDIANASAADVHFDTVYGALRSMRLLPDWSRRLQMVTYGERFRNSRPEEFALALQAQWRSLTSVTVALCENDPNVFVRKQTQQWLQRIDSQIDRMTKQSPGVGGSSPWHIIDNIRAALSFGWRLASTRSGNSFHRPWEGPSGGSSVGTCLTEFYFADRAVRAAIDSLTGFNELAQSAAPSVVENRSATDKLHGSLQRFHKTSMMPNVTASLSAGTSTQPNRGTDSMTTLLSHLEHVLQRYVIHLAYLYSRYKTAAFNHSPGVALHQWQQMAYELSLIHSSYLPPARLQQFFLRVVLSGATQESNDRTTTLQIDDLALSQTQFVELFVVVAFELYRNVMSKHRKHQHLRGPSAFSLSASRDRCQIDDIWRSLLSEAGDHEVVSYHHPAQVLSLFLHELVSRMALLYRTTPHEVGFSQKLACPLVGRALLEHRAFLRSVFFYYAKQDEDAADQQSAAQLQQRFNEQMNSPTLLPTDSTDAAPANTGVHFQLEKTKRNSMSFGEFRMFLGEFNLVRGDDTAAPITSQLILSLEDAQRIFQTVMAVDNDDVSQLEFDEFVGAVVALAVFFVPDPFTLWHEKIHTFVGNLKRCMREDDVRLQC